MLLGIPRSAAPSLPRGWQTLSRATTGCPNQALAAGPALSWHQQQPSHFGEAWDWSSLFYLRQPKPKASFGVTQQRCSLLSDSRGALPATLSTRALAARVVISQAVESFQASPCASDSPHNISAASQLLPGISNQLGAQASLSRA